MDALPKTIPTSTSPAAAATPSASAPAKARGQTAAAGAEEPASDAQGADAFMAALLAQGSMAVLNTPEPTPVVATPGGSAEAVAAQVLPLARPALAALLPGVLRPATTTPLAGDSVDGDTATLTEDAPLAVFASALDDATGGTQAVPGEARAARGEAAAATPFAALDFARDGARGFELVNAEAGASAGDTAPLQGTGRGAAVVAEQPAYGHRYAPLPVADAQLFAERLNQQITVMINQHNQHARIACAPPELGPVDVRISLVGDEASVQLAAPDAATREALEEALPRLRAALADSGLALGQAGVFADMPQRQQQTAAQFDGQSQHPAYAQQELDTPEAAAPPSLRLTRLGLVDAFV